MATTEEKNGGNGKDMKGKTCPCGCDNCGCTGWGGPWNHHQWAGFWLVRIVIMLILLGVAFGVGVMVGRFHEEFHRGYMMPYGYYGQAYPGMMGGGYGYGAGGTQGAIPPVPTNGATGASGTATAPASSTLR